MITARTVKCAVRSVTCFLPRCVRYDEIFRADQSGGSENQSQNQNQGENQNTQLAELQKQIVIATWKLQREKRARPAPEIHENIFSPIFLLFI